MRKVLEKLGGFPCYDAIRKVLLKGVYETLKSFNFEAAWGFMIQRFGVADNEWLRSLYEHRALWAPVYLKESFFMGMSATRPGETLPTFFYKYLHKQTPLKEFLDKYELVLQKKQKEEVEVEEMYSCFSTTQIHIDGPVMIFLVKERVLREGNRREIRDFEVLYNRAPAEVRCICSCFNFYGYLCKHALCVLNFNGVEEIPSKYILSRWKKDYKWVFVHDHTGADFSTCERVKWFDQLCRIALQVVEEGAISLENYKVALEAFEESLERVHNIEETQVLPSPGT
ncbi:hypothetical protein ACS0TY_034208 [Phlomoides rotata]